MAAAGFREFRTFRQSTALALLLWRDVEFLDTCQFR